MTETNPPEKPWFPICVSKDNAYLVKSQPKTGKPPAKILMPWVDSNDPRLFVRNGELIKPYGVVEFEFVRLEECPELDHNRACYREINRSNFDPAGCAPIQYFNLEKHAEVLNEAQALLEKRIADTPLGSA
jgi:hypothetical protein